MSKYEPLRQMLAGRKEARWSGRFADIERVLASSLPDSARRHRPWWANQSGQGHVQAHAWMGEGWRVERVDLQREEVEFVRDERAAARPPRNRMNRFEHAATLTGITDRETLTDMALDALIEREAIDYLARLGGTMPDAAAPDRRRL